MTYRDAQIQWDNRQEPDPDERNWREIPQKKPLEGEDLYDYMDEIIRRGKNEPI